MPDPVRNSDLCALLDGECDPGARTRLEAGLARSPQCAERLALWRRNDAALRLAVLGVRPGGPALEAPPRLLVAAPPPMEAQVFEASAKMRAALVAGFTSGAACGAAAIALILLN